MSENEPAYKAPTPWAPRQKAVVAAAVLVFVAVIGITASQIIFGIQTETIPVIESSLSGEEVAQFKQMVKKGGEMAKTIVTDPVTHEAVNTVFEAYWQISPTRMAGQALKDLCYENQDRCLDTISKPWRDPGQAAP
jgi:hypothetical protein